MLESETKNLVSILGTPQKKSARKRLLWRLPKSKDVFDRVSSQVWGVLSGIPKDGERIRPRHKVVATRFATTVFSGREIRDILKNTQVDIKSIVTNKIENMDEPVLFEYFLVDFLSRRTRTNGISSVLKGDRILDNELATDFTFRITNPDGKIETIGTQLTTIYYKTRDFKTLRMKSLRTRFESGEIDDLMQDLPKKVRPDILAMISVNGIIGKQLYNQKTPFKDAYTKWKENGYKSGGPTQFLNKETKEAFEVINHFLPEMTKFFFVGLSNNFSSIKSRTIVFNKKKYVLKLKYSETDDIFSVLLFEEKGGEQFVFSVDFTQSRYSETEKK